ncbi:MAG TPA: TlpA disulfide reductase family protein [Niabella sp.]|nr:TlpA disulfide reductase family protein [Niabella sp.]HRB78790.1 TlpA disulfide reductase family protein [Niabella sp.]HRB94611.1 TlpA disulfide reductase family protein [Niabella sp.]
MSGAINIVLIGLVLALLFIPSFKARVLNGLMSIGLFQPSVEKAEKQTGDKVSANIQFAMADGRTIHSDSFKGKVVFINFWATWCPPCLAEMPSIHNLYASFKNDPRYIFLLVDADNDITNSTAFIKEKKYDLPVVGTNNPIPTQWFGETLPATVVLDKEGKIAYHHEGIANYETKAFQKFLKRLAEK